MSGVAEVLDAHGHTLLLLPGRGHDSQPAGSANIADGFIVYGLMPNNQLLQRLPYQRPLVSVDFDVEGCPTVHIDDTEASYRIACYALKQRPERPAIINLRLTVEPCNGRVTAAHTMLPSTSTISRARLAGFMRRWKNTASRPARCRYGILRRILSTCAARYWQKYSISPSICALTCCCACRIVLP